MNKKFEKNYEKSRRRMLIEKWEEEHPYIPTDEEILENNKYWDIDYLEKINANTSRGIRYWKERYDNAANWIGKWYFQIRINKLKKKLHHYVDKK